MVKKLTKKEWEAMNKKPTTLPRAIVQFIALFLWNVIVWGFLIGLFGAIIKFVMWAWGA